jgi:hypothetical protein
VIGEPQQEVIALMQATIISIPGNV